MFKKRVAIIPYLMGSRTAKALKNALQQKLDIPVRLFRKNSLHYQPRWADYRDWETDRKSTRLNSSHSAKYRMPSSA